MTALALEVKNLVKVYDPGARARAAGTGEVRALDGLDLEVAAGETLGFLGPNGAGKTTAIRTIATLVRPTSGTVKIAGVDALADPDGARMHLGYVPQELSLDRMLTVREHLELAGRLHRLPSKEARARADEVLKLVRLDDKAETRAKKLSGGMKKRLDLGMGLVHRPKLLVLDEPTVGLDLDARRAVWDFLQSLKAQGTSILISTHSMEEADHLSDRVAIVDKGKVRACARTDDLKGRLEGDVISVALEGALPDDAFVEQVRKVEGARNVTRVRDGFEVTTTAKDPKILSALVEVVKGQGRAVASVTYRKPTLEDVFLRVVGRAFREGESA